MAAAKHVKKVIFETDDGVVHTVTGEGVYHKFVDFTEKKVHHRSHTISWTETSDKSFLKPVEE